MWIPRAHAVLTVVAVAGLAFGVGWFTGLALAELQNP